MNALHQVENDGENKYFYDRNGNLIEKIKKNNVITKYDYDAWDRLISIQDETQKINYQYDDNNRRLSKTFYQQSENGDWIKIKFEKYLYQGPNEIGSCDESGNILELRVLGNGKGAEIGAAIALEINGEVYAPIHDSSGNVTCLIDPANGEIIESYRYSAFGEETSKESISPWRFASKRYDTESGFVYFGRRYYDPGLGRWVTPDPIGREGGPNLYAYVLNSPLTHFDAYGLFGEIFSQMMSGANRMFKPYMNALGEGFNRVAGFWKQECPIPIVRDIFSGMSHFMRNGTFNGYKMEYQKQHTYFDKVPGIELDPKHLHGYLPGITNDGVSSFQQAERISMAYANSIVYCLCTSMHGIMGDALNVGIQKMNIFNNVVKQAVTMARTMLKDVGSDGIATLLAFSRGGQILDSLRYYLSAGRIKTNSWTYLRFSKDGF